MSIEIYKFNAEPFNENRLNELVFRIRSISSCFAEHNSLVEQLHKQLDEIEVSMLKGMDYSLKHCENAG